MTTRFEAKVALITGRNPRTGPAIIKTPILEGAVRGNEGLDTQLNAIHPLWHIGQAEEIAAVSPGFNPPGNSFVNGHAPAIDGSRLI